MHQITTNIKIILPHDYTLATDTVLFILSLHVAVGLWQRWDESMYSICVHRQRPLDAAGLKATFAVIERPMV